MKKIYLIVLLSVFCCVLYTDKQVYAAPVVGFNPGAIIDDATFTNKSTMSVMQIQSFLDTKVPTCDTNGQELSEYGGSDLNGDGKVQRWEWAKVNYNQTTFPCLKDYIAPDGRKSSQVIYDSANYWGINPQVILVLLQKEQGLVTDTWPLTIQYRSATGYGCPDTAACSSTYYGLVNQIDWSTKMFRAIMNNSPNWYTPYVLGTNYIQYNPNSSCGGSTVNIQNRATQALYNYTPYQPNQASIDVGWGVAPPCGAYGNRNFYLYFNEWFGGYLINTVDNGNLYIRGANGSYYQITSARHLTALGISIPRLKIYNTTSAYLGNLTNGGPLTSAVQFDSHGDIYSIDSNQLRYYNSVNYAAYGRPTVSNLAAGLDGIIPRGPDMTTVLSENNVGNLFSMSDGERRYIAGGAVYNNEGYSSIPITWMSGYFVNSLPKGAPIMAAGTVVQTSDTKIASVINPDRNSKRIISNAALSAIAHKPYVDSSEALDKLSTTNEQPISTLSSDSRGNLYIVDWDKKVLLSPALLNSINRTPSDFTIVDDSYLNRFRTVVPAGDTFLFWLDGGARIYHSESGEMIAILTMDIFNQLGYNLSNVVHLNSYSVAQLFTNTDRLVLPEGSLYSIPSIGRVYTLDNNHISHAITTGDLFNDFGFPWNKIYGINQSTLDHYTRGADVSNLVTTPDGNRWLVTNGRHYGLPTQLSLSYDPTQTRYTPVSYESLKYSLRSRDASRFIRINNNARVYYMDGGLKYPIGSVDAFFSRGGTWDQVISVSESTARMFANGSIVY